MNGKNSLRILMTRIARACLRLFWVCPIKCDRVLFISFDGIAYSDNPMYAYRELINSKVDLEYVWAFWKPDANSCNAELKKAKIINRASLEYIYYALTSKVIITNCFISSFLPIRRLQVLVNTWHGGGTYKTVGMTDKDPSAYDEYFFKLHCKETSAFVSMSEAFTENNIKNSFLYNKTVLNFGMARNSVLFKETSTLRKKIHEYYGIPDKSKIVLFLPTYRSPGASPVEPLNVETCLNALRTRFASDFMFVFRAHHLTKIYSHDDGYIDATLYPDVQELLCAADVLISDYSSALWDFTLLKRPIFLFAPDLQEYEDTRDFMWPITRWPYPLAENNDTLIDMITTYNSAEYMQKYDKYIIENVSYENEDSSRKLAEYIVSCATNRRKGTNK